MARKKTAETANLKAAPVLRSGGGGDQPVTPTITKSYCVRDDWKDNGTVNYVAFKSVDGEVQDLTVNGEPAGGGGSSDFTLAEVTVIQNEDSQRGMFFPVISDDKLETQELLNGSATMVLYKGSFFIMDAMSIGAIASVSGDIEEVGAGKDSYYRIYGNCTITLA